MILKIGILITLILGGLIFLGFIMGQKFEDKKVKMFFFILYGMSIFTLFNIIISYNGCYY